MIPEPANSSDGYVILPMSRYLELTRQLTCTDTQPVMTTPWEALRATVALLTARIDGTHITAEDLAPDVPADAVLRIVTAIAASALRELLPDHGARVLQDLGIAAAMDTGDDAK